MMNSEIGFGRKVLEVLEDNEISFEHLPSGIDNMSIVVSSSNIEGRRDKLVSSIRRAVRPDSVTIEDELGEAALDAIRQYYKLTDAEKKLVTTEALRNVVRPAALYINRLYYKVAEQTLGENIYIGADAAFSIGANCTYENVLTAIENLSNEDDPFNVYAKLLRDIKKDFSSMVFKDNIKISSYIIVHSEEDRLFVLDLLDHMVKLHNILSVIDDEKEWTIEDLTANEKAIQDAVSKIRTGQFVGTRYTFFYSVLSSWRKNDDFFDIIYSYYLYGDDDMKSLITEELWMQVPLPGVLEDWYLAIVNAYSAEQFMYNNAEGDAYLYDTSAFVYYYYQTEQYVDQIKNSGNQLYLDLYEHLTCDLLFTQYLRNSTYGYLYHFDKMIDSERFVEAWDTYVELIEYYLTLTGAEGEVVDPAPFENTMLAIASLTPTELNAFINSLHFLYRTARGSALVFEYEETAQSTLIMLLASYYEQELGEEAAPLFQDLLLAMENLSLIGIKSTAEEDFKASMKALIDGREALEGDTRDVFDTKLGDIFNMYYGYYDELCKETKTEIPEEYAAAFAELYELLRALEEVDAFLASKDENVVKDGVHAILFTIYERVEDIRNSIVTSGNDTVVTIFATKPYEFIDTQLTLDRASISARAIFIRYMINGTITQNKDGVETVYIAWDFYKDSDVRDFFADLAPMFKSYFKNETLDSSVLTLMAALRALPDNVRSMFFTFDAEIIYYKAVARYFETVLANDGDIVNALLEAESLYNKYITTLSAEDLAAFCDKIAEVGELYTTVSDKATFDSTLLDMYNYYLEMAEKLSATEEA
jgi:hypothetical protein